MVGALPNAYNNSQYYQSEPSVSVRNNVGTEVKWFIRDINLVRQGYIKAAAASFLLPSTCLYLFV